VSNPDMSGAFAKSILLALLLGLNLSAQEPEPQITGRVTLAKDGSPIPGAVIRLIPPIIVGQLNFQSAMTDSNGAYRFHQVREGAYFIEASKDGFVPQTYKRDASPEGTAERVNASTRLTGMNFQMTPEAVISGIVTNSEAQPVPAVSVAVVAKTPNGSPRHSALLETKTDTNGHFALKGLPAGTYFVCVNGPNGYSIGPNDRVWYRERWYKDATSPEAAVPITVEEGEDQTGLRIIVEREKRFNVIVWPTGPDGQVEPDRYDVMLEHRSHSSSKQADGSYIIPAIPAGHYTLVSTAWSGVQYVGQGETSFDITGADVNVPLHLGGLGEIEGQVKWAGATGAGGLMIAINSEEGAAQAVHIDAQGNFRFARVLPGRYKFKLLQKTPGVVLRNAVCDGKEVTGDLLLQISDRQETECSLTLAAP
jgi:Carboxypeptidase regulatory-like domain